MKKLWFKFLDFFSLKKKIKKDGKIYTRVSIEEFKKKIAEDKLPSIHEDHLSKTHKKSNYSSTPKKKSSFKNKRYNPRDYEVNDELNSKQNLETFRKFDQFAFDASIVDALDKNSLTHSTIVQDKTLDLSLAGRNIICASETGSGKTLAFLLPLLEGILSQRIQQALILSPTREIAIQTDKVIKSITSNFNDVNSGLVIGGLNVVEQKNILRDYPQIIVATPGRLLDMMSKGLVWLQYTEFVVLDEADRMLDMGFEEDLLAITKELPESYQCLLFTATLMPRVEQVANRYANNYEKIIIGKAVSSAKNVEHKLIQVAQQKKYSVLKQQLKTHGRIIVFFNTIDAVRKTSEILKKDGYTDIESIHSGRTQEERERIITQLKEGKKRILLATDVAARGIDIPKVELVINYHIPNSPEEYIHRIGRTGRAGHKGQAVSFYSPKDKLLLEGVEKVLGEKILIK